MRRSLLLLIAVCCVLADRTQAEACKLSERPQSLLDRFIDAPILVTGRFQNAVGPDNALPSGQTELVLDDIIVPHDLLKGRKMIVVPREISSKEEFLVALEINKGQLEAYGGVEIDAKGEIVKYVRGARQLKDKSAQARLRYSVDFLQSRNSEVARSAHLELGRAARTNYADFRKVAESLKSDSFVKALQAADTSASQRDTFAMLLGHCGKKEDAVILRKLIDANWEFRGGDSMLFGYALLEPEAGWRLITTLARQKDKPFLQRYAALQAMRRLGAERNDLVDAKKCVQGIALFLDLSDMADFAVEDLRKMKRWEYCDEILELPSKKGYGAPIIRKSVLRYALECPMPTAKAHVHVERDRDPEWVADTEELLELEREAPGPKK
jgi:hypothetical protein